jgi:hypothetical protein
VSNPVASAVCERRSGLDSHASSFSICVHLRASAVQLNNQGWAVRLTAFGSLERIAGQCTHHLSMAATDAASSLLNVSGLLIRFVAHPCLRRSQGQLARVHCPANRSRPDDGHRVAFVVVVGELRNSLSLFRGKFRSAQIGPVPVDCSYPLQAALAEPWNAFTIF